MATNPTDLVTQKLTIYHHQYFEACDMLLQELNLLPSQYLENLLMEAAKGDVYDEALKSPVYSSDISFEKLHQELPLLVTLITQALPTVIKVTFIVKL